MNNYTIKNYSCTFCIIFPLRNKNNKPRKNAKTISKNNSDKSCSSSFLSMVNKYLEKIFHYPIFRMSSSAKGKNRFERDKLNV